MYGTITASTLILTDGLPANITTYNTGETKCRNIYTFNNKYGDYFSDWSTTGTSSISESPNGTKGNALAVQNTGDRVVIQSKEYVSCNTGYQLLGILTFCPDTSATAAQSGVAFRIGMFDDEQDKTNPNEAHPGGRGFFLEYSGGVFYLCERTSDGSTHTDTKVEQSSWNVDTLSALTASQTITMVITKEDYLGNYIIISLTNEDVLQPVHRFSTNDYTNTNGTLSVPVRVELECAVDLPSAAEASFIDAAVNSLSTDDTYYGNPYSYTLAAGKNVVDTLTPVLSIANDDTLCRRTVYIDTVDFINLDSDPFFYDILWNANLSNANFVQGTTYESYIDTEADAYSGGYSIMSGYAPGQSLTAVPLNFSLCSDMYGAQTTLTVVCKTLSSTTAVTIGCKFKFWERLY